ncbi:AMP-binding protein [Fulvivirga sediminis]|uniref:Long-chain-fatty-acid--CoA ligase n=1 Tax=Fulvivirga sediminis TaxID=2803949 RepID=A0A937F6Z4_9BACT|nr:AMP-binding protein [Fulvivirga sediminis]MBL3657516.1 AMP-binding protein [Fulvivirga sediminis]
MQSQAVTGQDCYPWHKQYPKEIPSSINPHRYESLVELLHTSVRKFGTLPAYHCMGTTITYDKLNQLSSNFASYLQNDLDLKPGTPIAIQLPNILQYPIALFGALRAGMIIVNTNPLYTPREIKHQLVDSGAKVIVILANFAHKLEEITDETAVDHVVITEMGDQLGRIKKILVNGVVKHVKKMIPSYHLPGATKFNQALSSGKKQVFKKVYPRGWNTAFLQYTGGTTGVSKGAVLTHTNIVANIEQFYAWLLSTKIKQGEETMITALPLYHILALVANCFLMMKIGAKNVLIPNPRDMQGFVKELSKHKFSLFSGVNTLYNGLMNESGFEQLDFSNLKLCGAGGMAVQANTAKKWKKMTGCPISEGYGLTETSPILTFNIVGQGKERIGSIGLPIPNTKLIIVNENEDELPEDVPGEIFAKGPQVMKEYHNNPTETEKVFTKDGWLKTGDIGVKDKDGFFRIVDRKKEMILVSGFNVYPNEIEEVISSHEKVREVAAIGIPDAKSDEAVKIFVVKNDPTLSEEELITYCKTKLTAYKVPKQVEFRDELPKSNVGKILRKALREQERV